MNCEQYQELISAFLDNDLDEKIFKNVQSHLAICAECAKVCEDCAMILDFCSEDLLTDSMPPNPKALWCRINNIIENEVKTEIANEVQQEKIAENRFFKFWNSRRQFSLTQVLSLIFGIAVISSVVTFVGIKSYQTSGDYAANQETSAFETVLSKVGLAETPEEKRERHFREQQIVVDYWNKRVEARRINWDAQLREAFDRNLSEINQVVVEYNTLLKDNPQDEISNEMLDSAMNEKVELLREFSEL